MNIWILANSDVGLYQFRKELIQALLKEHDVTLLLPDGDLIRPLEKMGCRFIDTPVDRRGINPVTDLKMFADYIKQLKRNRPDLVITYTIKPNIYGGLACCLLGIPYAVNITGLGTAFQKQGILRKLVTFLYRHGLKKAKVVFFENSANLELFCQENLVKEYRCCLLHGAGVNLEHYRPAPYPKEKGTTRFLFVGRVMREKGIEELFAAMERFCAEGEDCCLDVLGGYEEDYATVVREYEERGWLHYHGYVEDVRPYIARAHCFVLPSYHEGMANTNLESAAMGRPVITSDIPGCREAVVEGESGLLCQAQSANSLYEAMKCFVDLPEETRMQMGIAGRKHMEAVFDKKKVVEETICKLV